jgi:DNA-binding response OmpR family regulator
MDDVKKGWGMYLKLRPHFMIIGIENDSNEGLELFKQIRERDPIMPVVAITKNLSSKAMVELVNLHVHYVLTGELTRKKIRKALISCASFLGKTESAYIEIKDALDYYPALGILQYGDKKVPLTQKERHLLLLLLQNRGRIVYYEEIEYKVWMDTIMTSSALKSTVKNIHSKAPFKFITNYSKEGYGISL